VLGAPIGLCSEEHELISREGHFSGSIIHILYIVANAA
jgi:hypothetical protein